MESGSLWRSTGVVSPAPASAMFPEKAGAAWIGRDTPNGSTVSPVGVGGSPWNSMRVRYLPARSALCVSAVAAVCGIGGGTVLVVVVVVGGLLCLKRSVPLVALAVVVVRSVLLPGERLVAASGGGSCWLCPLYPSAAAAAVAVVWSLRGVLVFGPGASAGGSWLPCLWAGRSWGVDSPRG